MNVENLRKCIEQSPVLRYTYQTRTDCCKCGAVQTVTAEGSYLVNYEDKTAVSNMKTVLAEGITVIEKTVYRDCKIIKITMHEDALTEDLPQIQEKQLSEEEYAALFQEKGDLRPLNFDKLNLKCGKEQFPNTLSFLVEPAELSEMDKVGITDVRSSAVISLCSQDTMKLTQLSALMSSDNPQDMTLVTHNMTVHLQDA